MISRRKGYEGAPNASWFRLDRCLRARIMLETMALTTVGEADARAGQIALFPSLVVMQPHAHGTWSEELSLRDYSSEVAQFTVLAAHDRDHLWCWTGADRYGRFYCLPRQW